MKLLLIADEEDAYLWDHYRPGRLSDVDLILSAGDLKSDYLSFLVTMANKPLLYVHGNHDTAYDKFPPEGCECVDDRLVTVGGLRILGLGGSQRYKEGPYQYSERQMAFRIRRLERKIRKAGGVDIVLTHAPLRGLALVEPNFVRIVRTARGLTQPALAKLLGVHPDTVSLWESAPGPVRIKLSSYKRLAQLGGGSEKGR